MARRRVAVVLGSGLLDDVPIRELAASFHEVRLVDAVHPWPTRRWVRGMANVRLVTADIASATARSAAGVLLRSRRRFRRLGQFPLAAADSSLDRLKARGREAPPDLGRRIVAAHLRGLAGLTARVCLVTDTTEEERDREGRTVERLDQMHGLVLPPPDQDWDWELAPFGEMARNRRIAHRVRAYRDCGAIWDDP